MEADRKGKTACRRRFVTWRKLAPPRKIDQTRCTHLTAVQMRVSTAAVTPEDLGYMTVGSYDFAFIGADGLTFTNVATVATYGCISDSVRFPSAELRPGSQYAGTVLLDLPETSGVLIYQPQSVSGGGWEISY